MQINSPRRWARTMSTLKGSRRGSTCSNMRYMKPKTLKRRRIFPIKQIKRTRILKI